jgi:AcrR family transcriptional regulator
MPRPPDPTAKIKLLAAAEAVFVARGLDDARVEEIARRAGLGKGSFYLHFASKEDAFRQLVEAMLARMSTYLEALPARCPRANDIGSFIDGCVDTDLQIFEFIWQNRGLVGLWLESGNNGAFHRLVDRFTEGARLRLRGFLATGIEIGIYRPDLDVELASVFLAGAYERLARQLVRSPIKPDMLADLRGLQLLVLRGIGSTTTVADLARLAG